MAARGRRRDGPCGSARRAVDVPRRARGCRIIRGRRERRADANVGEKLRRARARLVGDETPPDAALVDAVWRWSTDLQCAIDGCGDLEEQGLHAYRNYEELGGSHLPGSRLVGGFSGLTAALADEGSPPLRESIRLGTRVVGVAWSDDSVTLECAGGERLHAPACVLAVPLPALRTMRFEPPLPARNAEGLSKLELGAVEKVFVPFSAADDGTPPRRSTSCGRVTPAARRAMAARATRSRAAARARTSPGG